jgi:hypothetical protein
MLINVDQCEKSFQLFTISKGFFDKKGKWKENVYQLIICMET